jgi:hypothetical protein
MSSQAGALMEPRATDGAGQLAHRPGGRFQRSESGAEHHEQRGHGWRAAWDEGAESLSLEREPAVDDPAVVPVPPISG